MASAIVAMIAANRLLTPSFVSRKDSGGNPSPELSDVLSWPKERVKKWIQEECRSYDCINSGFMTTDYRVSGASSIMASTVILAFIAAGLATFA